LIFLLIAAAFAAAGDKPRVSRVSLVAMEKSLDDRVTRLWNDNPFVLLGPTRGVYLEGYGAVFTAEVNMVAQPTSLMNPIVTKKDVIQHHQKKLERMPQLKSMLREALASTAASLDTVPAEEQITIIAFLTRYPWEDMTGLPVQVVVQAPKKKLLEAQRGGPASLEAAIRVTTEN
jgi:hypothetical protein